MILGDGVLRVPIQMNGGSVRAKELPSGLINRELFIDSGTGMLYYGDNNGNSHIVTIRDYNHDGRLFNFSPVKNESGKSKGSTATIGGLVISSNGNSGGYKFTPYVEYDDKGEKTMDLTYKIQFSGIRLGSLVLTDSNYGNKAKMDSIKEPQEGQIFFLIP